MAEVMVYNLTVPAFEEKREDMKNVFEASEKIVDAVEILDAAPSSPSPEAIDKVESVAEQESATPGEVAKVMSQWVDGSDPVMNLDEELEEGKEDPKAGVNSDFVPDSSLDHGLGVADGGGGGGDDLLDTSPESSTVPIGFEDDIEIHIAGPKNLGGDGGGGGGGGGGSGPPGGAAGAGGGTGEPTDPKDKKRSPRLPVPPKLEDKLNLPPPKGKK